MKINFEKTKISRVKVVLAISLNIKIQIKFVRTRLYQIKNKKFE
jgi:hypothetical protein